MSLAEWFVTFSSHYNVRICYFYRLCIAVRVLNAAFLQWVDYDNLNRIIQDIGNAETSRISYCKITELEEIKERKVGELFEEVSRIKTERRL